MKIATKVAKKINTNKLNYKNMKRFQVYLNGRAIKDTNSLVRAGQMYEETCNKASKVKDYVELYDSEIGITIYEY